MGGWRASSQTVSAHQGEVLQEGTWGVAKLSQQSSLGSSGIILGVVLGFHCPAAIVLYSIQTFLLPENSKNKNSIPVSNKTTQTSPADESRGQETLKLHI